MVRVSVFLWDYSHTFASLNKLHDCPLLAVEHFQLLIHMPGTVCRCTSLQHHLYRLSLAEATAILVRLQLSILISCSVQLPIFVSA